jgi:hypothetical protein
MSRCFEALSIRLVVVVPGLGLTVPIGTVVLQVARLSVVLIQVYVWSIDSAGCLVNIPRHGFEVCDAIV